MASFIDTAAYPTFHSAKVEGHFIKRDHDDITLHCRANIYDDVPVWYINESKISCLLLLSVNNNINFYVSCSVLNWLIIAITIMVN